MRKRDTQFEAEFGAIGALTVASAYTVHKLGVPRGYRLMTMPFVALLLLSGFFWLLGGS